ncbi:MAG: endonuclease domain-containing protein [Candidatus Peregrinibacteria bacterium]
MREESLLQRKRRKLLYALKLRRRMTIAERILWNALRRKQPMELKFRRQVPLSWYVVDFLCVEKNLIIELDGGVHAKQKSYDREREEELRCLGYRILRFSNDQVLRALPEVINAILRKCSTPEG